jgi:hypothetical protein
MDIKRSIVLCAATIAASISCAHAGPCSPEIESIQSRVDARLQANAAHGLMESSDALKHRQPTPSSIAQAEERLREVSAQMAAPVKQAMDRARAADSAGDKNACEQALADVQHLIGS